MVSGRASERVFGPRTTDKFGLSKRSRTTEVYIGIRKLISRMAPVSQTFVSSGMYRTNEG